MPPPDLDHLVLPVTGEEYADNPVAKDLCGKETDLFNRRIPCDLFFELGGQGIVNGGNCPAGRYEFPAPAQQPCRHQARDPVHVYCGFFQGNNGLVRPDISIRCDPVNDPFNPCIAPDLQCFYRAGEPDRGNRSIEIQAERDRFLKRNIHIDWSRGERDFLQVAGDRMKG